MTEFQQGHKRKTPPFDDGDGDDAKRPRIQYGNNRLNPRIVPCATSVEGTDNVAPDGMELRLVGLPTGMRARKLLEQLATYHLKLDYAFLVIFDKSLDTRFWEFVDNAAGAHELTARIIIPNDSPTSNPGRALVDGKYITIQHSAEFVRFQVRKIKNPETKNHRYAGLRGSTLDLESSQGLQEGLVGDLRHVSYGNFGDNYEFETFHTWSYGNEPSFGSLTYLSDARPPRFRVCLGFSRGTSLEWEWMDILENSICGLVFEAPNCQSEPQDHWVVYFVVDKPPRFYRRSRANQGDPRPVRTRISHPTSLSRQWSTDVDVCDVPWPVQYCRVLKVEYRMRQDFGPRSYEPRICDERKEPMFRFERPPISGSVRKVDDMVNTLRANLISIATVMRSCTGCELGLVKLLYNCNLSATSPKSTHILQQRVVRVLTHENHPLPQIAGLQGFEFLGYNMSSLKKRNAVWFFWA